MLQILDLVFCAKPLGDTACLPSFLGPTLRGAFGFALKDVVCQMSHRRCEGCILRRRCAYPIVFEGVAPEDRTVMRKYPNVPQPFVFVIDTDFRERPECLRWRVRLFGTACKFWAVVTQGFLRICESGIGKARVKLDIDQFLDLRICHVELYVEGRFAEMYLLDRTDEL